jgi:peptidoglycan/xylan/chitin deacetylase (PgdA/CDA1 family)
LLAAVNYHYIRKNFDYKYPSIFGETPEQFEKQLLELSKFGEFISQLDLNEYITNGKSLPEKSILITFDDGLNEQYELALPVLERHNIPAVFFINTLPLVEKKILNVHKIHIIRSEISSDELFTFIKQYLHQEINEKELVKKSKLTYKYDDEATARTKYILNFFLSEEEKNEAINKIFNEYFPGKEEEICSGLYMNKEAIKDLYKKGYLGCHGHEHTPLALSGEKIIESDIKTSKNILEKIAAGEIYSFSYPYGTYEATKGIAKILKRSGFNFAFTMERGIVSDFSQPFYLSRFSCTDMPLAKGYKYSDNNFFNHLPVNEWKYE